MRIGLTLENPRRETVIPLNYNQLLAASIYWALGASSTDYAEHLGAQLLIPHAPQFVLIGLQ